MARNHLINIFALVSRIVGSRFIRWIGSRIVDVEAVTKGILVRSTEVTTTTKSPDNSPPTIAYPRALDRMSPNALPNSASALSSSSENGDELR
jgi:hypothetical protein